MANAITTATRSTTSLLTYLMAPRVNGSPVYPGAVITVRSIVDPSATYSVKVKTIGDMKGRQGFTGWTLNPETGMPYRGEDGKRSGTWGYLHQVAAVTRKARQPKA